MKPPHRLTIEFTNCCNFQCKLCPQSIHGSNGSAGNRYDRERGYLSEEVFARFVEEAHNHARSVCVGFFGEQMLHPEFGEYLTRLAEGRTYRLTLFSNWSMMTDRHVPALMNCDVVKIGLDASGRKLFDKLCPDALVKRLCGSYAQRRDSYHTIVDKINYWLGLPHHPETYLVYTKSSINAHDSSRFTDMWIPRISRNDGIIMKSCISYGGIMSDPYMTPNRCQVAEKRRLTVAHNGDVSPCNLDVNMSLKIGNILDMSLADICSRELYDKSLDGIRTKTSICANCFDANNHRQTRIYHGSKNAA